MSASTAISDVTRTIEGLLRDEQRPAGLFDVSLTSPADERVNQGMRPRVNVYLFRVIENENAKNQHWTAAGETTLVYPPLRLNLFYVLTPFADNLLDEHRVLGEAMRVLHDNGMVEPARLAGALAHGDEELKIDLCKFNIEEQTRIWEALDRAYRLSICYEARIITIDSRIERTVGRVTEKVEDYVVHGR